MKRVAVGLALTLSLVVTANAQTFVGDLLLKALPDGRTMQLASKFGFKDVRGVTWNVPKGWEVDGASIPTPLWSFVGAPFSGKYRDASVIHDYFCDTKARPWQEVHRVFYEAMLARGVGKTKAKVMYLAVYRFGPRWNYQPECPKGRACDGSPPYIRSFQPRFKPSDLSAITALVENNPDVEPSSIEPELDARFLDDVRNNARARR